MDKEFKSEMAKAKQNHLGFWLCGQDVDLDNVFKRVKEDNFLNGTERKRMKNLTDRTYYDSLFETE